MGRTHGLGGVVASVVVVVRQVMSRGRWGKGIPSSSLRKLGGKPTAILVVLFSAQKEQLAESPQHAKQACRPELGWATAPVLAPRRNT